MLVLVYHFRSFIFDPLPRIVYLRSLFCVLRQTEPKIETTLKRMYSSNFVLSVQNCIIYIYISQWMNWFILWSQLSKWTDCTFQIIDHVHVCLYSIWNISIYIDKISYDSNLYVSLSKTFLVLYIVFSLFYFFFLSFRWIFASLFN